MATYQVGGTRRPTLTIDVFDGNTVVTLAVVCEDTGVVLPVAVTGVAGTWTANAPYTITSPGHWVERWTAVNAVSGLGAGKAFFEYDVVATPPALGPGQTAAYATVTQYASIIGGTIPTNLARLLRIASRQLDGFLFSSIYDITDATVLAVLVEATCEQVAYMGVNGWWTTGGIPGPAREISIGSVKVGAPAGSSAGGGGAVSQISPIAYELLLNNGMIGGQPDTYALTGWWGP